MRQKQAKGKKHTEEGGRRKNEIPVLDVKQETLASIDWLKKRIAKKYRQGMRNGELGQYKKRLTKLRACVRRALEKGGKVEAGNGDYGAELVKVKTKRKMITRLKLF